MKCVIAFKFSNEIVGLSDALATIQTQKYWLQTSEVITYPLIQETFALLESNVDSQIDRQNFGVDFESKQI